MPRPRIESFMSAVARHGCWNPQVSVLGHWAIGKCQEFNIPLLLYAQGFGMQFHA